MRNNSHLVRVRLFHRAASDDRTRRTVGAERRRSFPSNDLGGAAQRPRHELARELVSLVAKSMATPKYTRVQPGDGGNSALKRL